MLGDVGDGAAVFAAQAETLDHAQQEQGDRGGDSDLVEGWDQTDHPGAEAHSGERDEEGVLAPHPVSQPSEQERSQRTDQEARREQGDGAQEGSDRVRLLEEFDR
jgi:hypothetical protein